MGTEQNTLFLLTLFLLTLFRLGGYEIDTCLPFSLYLRHGFALNQSKHIGIGLKNLHFVLGVSLEYGDTSNLCSLQYIKMESRKSLVSFSFLHFH